MNNNIYLSPHFTLREFTESATACKYGIVNIPPAEAVENLRRLCENTLEPLREALGLPVVITSGYRCKALNERITHHSSTSQHVKGQAADFYVGYHSTNSGTVPTRRELLIKAFRTILTDSSVDFDQIILYPGFIHVSYVSREHNRRKLTQGFGNGKYCALTREAALRIY